MFHGDIVALPLLAGESSTTKPEYLYIAVDDYSRELYAQVLHEKSQHCSAEFLKQVLDECPYTIECYYTDNGREYQGNPSKHEFMKLCQENRIEQTFTMPKTPRTNGKAERTIRTIKELCHRRTRFNSRAHRKTELVRFVNYYNSVKPHKGIDGLTPTEKLLEYFYPEKL